MFELLTAVKTTQNNCTEFMWLITEQQKKQNRTAKIIASSSFENG